MKMLSIAAVVLTCGLVAAAARPEGAPPPHGNSQPNAAKMRQAPSRPDTSKRARGTTPSGRRTPSNGNRRNQVSGNDQKLLDAIEEADALSELTSLFHRVQASRSAEVRLAMVEALEEQSKDAANMLAAFIGDADEEVSGSAFSAWVSKLEDMTPERRIQAIQAAAQTLQQSGAFQGGRMNGAFQGGHTDGAFQGGRMNGTFQGGRMDGGHPPAGGYPAGGQGRHP